MNEEEFTETVAKAQLASIAKGKMIFKQADKDSKVYWLVAGSLDLLDEKFEARNFKSDDENAKNPIDNESPHRFTAVTTGKSRILTIERSDLGMFNGDTQFGSLDIVLKEEGIDWMSTLLSSPLFEFIPPANIQSLFGKFEELPVERGSAIITQGNKGDYFYVIQAGRAKVERTVGDKTTVLAELKAGDNFGQDALVSDAPRNATVTMTTNGNLMRLSEPDFESLLMKPVLETITMEETREMIKQGDPKTYIIDVRSQKEAEEDKIHGSLNVPFLLLRKNAPKLKQEGIYVMADEGGKRAELGAYILNEKGFTAYVLVRSSD
jgi:CRP-like cAMP-binding protein